MARHEVLGLEDPYYPAGLPDVLRHVREAEQSGRVPGLKRPELLHRAEGAERVARHFPGAVVVISLREPIARAVSAYRHYVRHGLLPDLAVEQGLGRLLERREGRRGWVPGDDVLAHSCYSDGVRRFLQAPSLETLVVYQEELVADSGPTIEHILRRLDLEVVDLGRFPRANAGPALDCLGLERLANRICYDLRPESETFAVTSNVVRRGAGRLLRTISGVIPAGPLPVDDLSDGLRRRLSDHFAGDVAELERLLGRPVPSSWHASLAQ